MSAVSIDYEAILQLVYQLPVRQRFTLVQDVLQSLEPQLVTKQSPQPIAGTDVTMRSLRTLSEQRGDFWVNRSISKLAAAQGVIPAETIAQLRTDGWPAGDSIEEFLTTVRRWRQDDPSTSYAGDAN